MLDLPSLLRPVSAEVPSGPRLDGQAAYLKLLQAAEGKPEKQMGSTIIPAEPPDWRVVRTTSLELLEKSKDLRIGVFLARALLETGGFAGFADGLSLVKDLVGTFWDTFHPQLEAEDNNDPTERVSAMTGLVQRDLIQALRGAPIIKTRTFGAVTLRALQDAKAGVGPEGAASAIEAGFQEAPIDELANAAAALQSCSDRASELAAVWTERLPGGGPDFGELRKVLFHAADEAKRHLAARQGGDASASNGVQGAAPGAAAPPGVASAPGVIRSREDVVRTLDSICAYYARAEPSSPVPLLLQRCKRLVQMSFLDIVKDMVPDGLTTIETIAGKQDAES
jgi:type VI secretion system protein ImpA